MLARRGELHQILESFEFIPCDPMADPLDSEDDVSVTIRIAANTCPDTHTLAHLDVRQA